MSAYAKQALASVLTRVQESVAIDPQETYKQVTVRLFHKGVMLRGEKHGSAIRTNRQWQVREGQVLLSRIDARNGAIGIVPGALEGAIVTNDFWAFAVNSDRAIPAFLDAYFGTVDFVDACKAASEGTTNRVRLQPERFLKIEVPLPSLDEQRRVVSRIKELAAKTKEARKLRCENEEQVETLFGSGLDLVVRQLSRKHESQMLIRLVEQERGISYGVVLTGTPDDNGVPTLRAGDLQKFRVILTHVKKIDPSTEAKYRRTRLRGTELLLRIRGGLGELAVCPPEMVGGNVSREIAVIPFTERVLPKFGMYVLAAPVSQARMRSHLRGTSYVGINLTDVRTLPIPIPPISEQQEVIEYLDDLRAKVNSMKKLQSVTAAELDALMPSILSKAFRGEL